MAVRDPDALDALESVGGRPRLTVEDLDALDAPAGAVKFPRLTVADLDALDTAQAVSQRTPLPPDRRFDVTFPESPGEVPPAPPVPTADVLRSRPLPTRPLGERLGRAVVHGIRTSALGTGARAIGHALGADIAPVEDIDDSVVDRTVAGLAGLVTDLPIIVAGGALAGTAAREAVRFGLKTLVERFTAAGLARPDALVRASDALIRAGRAVVGAASGAGALGLEDMAREAARQAEAQTRPLEAGGARAPVDIGRIVEAGTRGAALGGLTFGLASQVPPGVLRALVEAGVFGAAGPPLREGRLPTVQDLLDSGVQLAAIKAAFAAAKIPARFERGVQIVEPGSPEAARAARAQRVGAGATPTAAAHAEAEAAAPPQAPARRPPGAPAAGAAPPAAEPPLPQQVARTAGLATDVPLPPVVQRAQDASARAEQAVQRLEELARTADEPPPLTAREAVTVEALDRLDEAAAPAREAAGPAVPASTEQAAAVRPTAPPPEPASTREPPWRTASYERLGRRPRIGERAVTPDGEGEITSVSRAPGEIRDSLLVRLDSGDETEVTSAMAAPAMVEGSPEQAHARSVIEAIGATGSNDAYVVARGQRFRVAQSDYGTFGRVLGDNIRLENDSEISAGLVDRVEDAAGNVLYKRESLPAMPSSAAPLGVEAQANRGEQAQAARPRLPARPAPATPARAGQQPPVPAMPRRVQRVEEPGVEPALDKPHGVYTTPADVESPHVDLGGEIRRYDVNPDARVLVLPDYGREVAMRQGAVGAGAGVQAARHLLGADEFARLKALDKSRLIEEAKPLDATVDWARYHDAQEVMEAIGAILARRQGYDALWLPDRADPAFSEFVALSPRALTPAAPSSSGRPARRVPGRTTPSPAAAGVEGAAAGAGREAPPPGREPARAAGPEGTVIDTPRYEHAERFGALVRAFEATLGRLPTDPRELRRLAAEATGIPERTFGQDPAAVDDLYDALEVAVVRTYRTRRDPALPLEAHVDRARAAEQFLGHRLRTIEVSKRQQFSTPLPIAEAAAYALDLQASESVVEPTAGTGSLLAPLPPGTTIIANEIDPRRAEALRLQGYAVTQADALRTPLPAATAIMNPPWGKYTTRRYGPPIPLPFGQSVDVAERFVVKTLRELPEGGRLVAVMPTTILRSQGFLGWLRREHTLRALIESPPGAYTTRGTSVESVLLVVDKGRVADAPAPIRATPASWQEYTAAVRPLAAGGTHSRVAPSRPDATEAVGRGASAASPPAVSAPHPTRRPGVSPERGPAPAGADAAAGESAASPAPAGEPGREPEGGVRRLPGRARAGAAGSDAGVVAERGGGAAAEPGGAGAELPGQPRGGPRPAGASRERFSVADPDELDAAARSPVFAPAPLRAAPGINPHPRLIVKARSLAGARLPDLTYQPQGRLLPDAYRRGVISDAQWDYGIIPALQAAARGHGYLAAADVGVGKTRIAAAVAAEWLETGTKRLLYVTASEVNIQDVKREFDLYAGGTWPFEFLEVKSFKQAKEGARGDYSPLPRQDGTVYLVDRYNLAAYRRALLEVGFDAIIGDEAHLLKNVEGAAVGQAWLQIQKQTLALGPQGRFLYLTATPAVDFDDLQHLIGLREWHPDGFEDYKARVTGSAPPETDQDVARREDELRDRLYRAIGVGEYEAWAAANLDPANRPFLRRDERRAALERNIAALEAELRRRGLGPEASPASMGSDAEAVGVRRTSKKMFRSGDPFGLHIMPAEQEQIMRELAMKGKYDSVDLWRAGVEFEIATHPLTPDQAREYAAMTDFFRDLNTAFLRFGRLNKGKKNQVTIRHFLQQEAKSRLFDYRLDHAIRLAQESLARGEQPVISVIRVREGSAEAGAIPAAINTINTRLVETDDAGEIVTDEEIPEALVVRAELLDRWREFRQTRNPIEVVQEAFGKDRVAVITGDVPPAQRERVIREFQEGRKPVALISGAGKTGISLHHVVETPGKAQGRRHLIVADYEWSATMFKQELGRVDRSGQRSAPRVTVLSSGAAGERKFLATIANRMRSLGALSKGSAESASNDKLAEFEIAGSLDTHAMRLAYRSLPEDIQGRFLGNAWKDPTTRDPQTGETRNTRSYPHRATLKDFLLDLQFMPAEDADRAFEAFWHERERLIREHEAQAEERESQRTRTNEGRILRATALTDTLSLHEVEDTHGHRFGILQGLVTDHMPVISRYLPTAGTGTLIRRYITFRAGDEHIAGLEIRQGAIRPLAEAFGHALGGELKTPEQVLEALTAGDRVPLQGEAGYVLRRRPSDKLIQIEGAKMAQRELLLRHGAQYVPAGNFWHVPADRLAAFLDRFPVRPRQPTAARQPNHADEATRQNLAEVRQERQREGQAGRTTPGLLAGPLARLVGRRAEPQSAAHLPQGPVAIDQDVERALTTTAARLGPPGLGERLRSAWQSVRRATTFEWDLRDFPLERDEIRVFQAQRRKAAQQAGEDVIGVVGGLQDREELGHFTRIVILRDLRSRAAQPERFPGGLPFGVSLEQVETELERLEATAPARVRRALEAHARLMEGERADLEARELLDPERAIADYFPHFVLDFEPQPRPPGARRLQEPRRSFLRRARGSERAIETDYVSVMFRHRAEVRFANAVDDFALSVLERHDRSDELPPEVRRALRPGQVLDLDGAPYRATQYRPGRAIFPAQTVPERALAEALARGADRLEIDLSELRARGALGRYYRIYVVPQAIAERFEHWAPAAVEDGLKLLNQATSLWKAVTIGFWGQAGHLTNLLGDLMNLARTPGALLHLPHAAADVIRWRRGTAGDLVRLMEEYDVLDSGYVANEVYWRVKAPELRQFLTQAQYLRQQAIDRVGGLLYGAAAGGLVGGPVGAALGGGAGFLVGARSAFQTLPAIREAIPRAAMVRYQLSRLRRGLPLRPGPIDIRGLEAERAAMKIAREFTVDYPKSTTFETRLLRGLLLPFYAWVRQNTPNWLRFLWASKLGALAFLGLRLLLELWNNGDEERQVVEQSLPAYKRQAAHVVTGWRDEAGRVIVIYWAGDPLADALGMVGLAGTPNRLSDLATGRLTLDQAARAQLEAVVREPGQRVVGLVTPLLKVPVELATNRSSLTGQPIVPDELAGTREALPRQVGYAAESFFRPLRETRLLREQAGKREGVDVLTHRFGLGLPIERVDVERAAESVALARWREARDEYVEAVVARLRDTAAFARLAPHQQDIALRQAAQQAANAFVRRLPPPSSRRQRVLRRFAE